MGDIRTRGVYVSPESTLQSNDRLALIPISLLFTLDNANNLLKGIIPQSQQETLDSLGPMDTLSLALIIEIQNEDSFWNAYLKCLPTMEQMKDEIQMPLYWTQQDIETYLDTSKIALFIRRRLHSVQKSFDEIHNLLQSVSYLANIAIEFTLDRWIWALSIVWSRSFSVMI